jgi:hypothetical protein
MSHDFALRTDKGVSFGITVESFARQQRTMWDARPRRVPECHAVARLREALPGVHARVVRGSLLIGPSKIRGFPSRSWTPAQIALQEHWPRQGGGRRCLRNRLDKWHLLGCMALRRPSDPFRRGWQHPRTKTEMAVGQRVSRVGCLHRQLRRWKILSIRLGHRSGVKARTTQLGEGHD